MFNGENSKRREYIVSRKYQEITFMIQSFSMIPFPDSSRGMGVNIFTRVVLRI